MNSIFSIILLVLGRPEYLSFSTDTQPALKHECHSESYVWLKECSQNLTKHFKGFGSRFTELPAKLGADTLLDFAIHRR
jgi:hypothetical protein